MSLEKLQKLVKVLKVLARETTPSFMNNRRTIIMDYVRHRTLVRGNPFVLHLEVTNKCNLKCRMCPRENMEREEGFMEFTLFKKIIDDARGKIEFVELYLFGEPLMHRKIFDMIKYCKEAGMHVGLSTNATLLDREKSHALVRSNPDLLILSLDAVTEQSYESIRTRGNYIKVLENIEYFLRSKLPASPMHTVVQMIKLKENADEVERFSDFWGNHGVQVHLKPFFTWRGDIDSINVLKHNTSKLSELRFGPCDRIWRHFTVFWDGTVVPCHFMYDKKCTLGNIQDKSLSDLWNGSKFLAFREQHILHNRNRIPCCMKCNVQPLQGWELFAVVLVDVFALRTINTILHYN